MPFVSSGFPALDKILAGEGGISGFPSGGLTLLEGSSGSGKSQLMRKCCARAHKKGLNVVYISSEDAFKADYPVIVNSSLTEVTRYVAELLHPGRRNKVNLLVLDSITHLIPDQIEPEAPIGNQARQLGQLLRLDFGKTAVVGTLQTRRSTLRPSTRPSSDEMGLQASVILNVSLSNSTYRLELVKSRVSISGVSCEIRPVDMEDIEYFDRSKIPTRYQRILRVRD